LIRTLELLAGVDAEQSPLRGDLTGRDNAPTFTPAYFSQIINFICRRIGLISQDVGHFAGDFAVKNYDTIEEMMECV
jgi:hypothetical protein